MSIEIYKKFQKRLLSINNQNNSVAMKINKLVLDKLSSNKIIIH